MLKKRSLSTAVLVLVCIVSLVLAWDQPETEIVQLINAERKSRGLQELRINASLMYASERHSLDMAENGFVGHTGSDGSTFWERMEQEGYTDWFAAAEVIVIAATPKAAVYHLMQSPEHRVILLKPILNEIGAGYVHDPSSQHRHYWTIALGGRYLCENCYIKTYLPLILRD